MAARERKFAAVSEELARYDIELGTVLQRVPLMTCSQDIRMANAFCAVWWLLPMLITLDTECTS